MVKHSSTTVALEWGCKPPIVAVLCDPPEVRQDGHTFFSVIYSDAPRPEDEDAVSSPPVCVDCLLEEYPEVGRGMDIALEHGLADRDPKTGEWRVCPDEACIDEALGR